MLGVVRGGDRRRVPINLLREQEVFYRPQEIDDDGRVVKGSGFIETELK